MLPFQSNYLQYLLAHPADESVGELELANGCRVRLNGSGAIEVVPQTLYEDCKAIILSAGVHGNETAPIEWLNSFLERLLQGELTTVHPLLLLFGHPQAMVAGVREIGTNLNRLFNGKHGNLDVDIEHRRARQLEQWVAEFFARYDSRQRYHYDLHTAIRGSMHEKFAVYPFTHGEAHHLQQLAFLQHCGVDCILFSNEPTTTFSYHSSVNHRADAFTVELGKVHPFGENDLSRLDALDNTMTALVSSLYVDEVEPDWQRARWYQVTDVVVREARDFRLNFADDLANFSEFESGAILAYQQGQPIAVESGPKAVVFPNAHVQIGHRAALLVKRMSQGECQALAVQG